MNRLVKVGLKLIGVVTVALGLDELDKRFRYNADGFNRMGFKRDGYDINGFDKYGYDREGFNKSGFNRTGFDSEGYDASGYNRLGYNREGYNARGLDIYYFDVEGFDSSGYDHQGYNREGADRSGKTREYYEEKVFEMKENSRKAFIQMKEGQFFYALRDIRVGIEKGVKAILAHKFGNGYEDNKLDYNIGICSRKKILDQDFIEKLYSAKMHCNDTAHEDREKTYNQVHFSHRVLEEVTVALMQITDLSSAT